MMFKLTVLLLLVAATSSVPVTPSTTPPVCSCSQDIGDCSTLDDHEQCAAACASSGMGAGDCRIVPPQLSPICLCTGPFAPGTDCGDAHPECLATTTPSAVTTTISQGPAIGPGPITITFPVESTSPSTATEPAASTTTIKVHEGTTTSNPEARCARFIRGVCDIIPDHDKCMQACQSIGLHVGVCLSIQPLISPGASVCACLS